MISPVDVVTCPADFPYAFDNGAKCCSADDPCTGSILNFYDTCCNSPETTCSNAVGPCGSAVVDGGWSDWVNGSCTETCGPGRIYARFLTFLFFMFNF